MGYLGKKKANFLFIAIVIITAIAICYSIHITSQRQISLSEQKILQEAIAHFDNMVITRRWNAMHGGVYVKQRSDLKPNPYLKDNTLQDAEGNVLIKINPAWMTRQISELSNLSQRYYYKITSLKPLNPKNAPDAFETEALHYFDKNRHQPYYFEFSEDRLKFNFMGVLKVEESCLNCHAEQNYQVGDIRGGIRVSVPSNLLKSEIETIHFQALKGYGVVLLASTVVLIIFYRFINMIYLHQRKVEHLNNCLERKITERTYRLEKMFQHERYIKELLKTVSGVNELLLTSLSIQSAVKNAADELAKHKHYRFTWVGLINKDLLEVAHKSSENQSVLADNVYSLKKSATNLQIKFSLDAIEQQKTIVQAYQAESGFNRRADDYILHWQVAIPLLSNDTQKPFGVFNIYSSRKQGFEEEEIRVLERLATDVGLILYSHKQKAVLEQMEVERVSNYEETILAFVNIIEQRDTYTAGHTLRVANYCKKLAYALQISEEDTAKLEKAAILHDIGKVATPDAVLLKPGRLNPLEYELIKQHAFAGYNMLSKIDMYQDLAEIIRYHHVRYDGKGYPETKSPLEVPFLSHIMVVADAFDAMTTNRIYKPRQTVANALAEIERFSGSQFHPQVVAAAVDVLQDVKIEATSQIPNTELEEKRFSYFFCDSLTELYNESYLQIMLSNFERPQPHLYLILINNFSQYNKHQGWEQGNLLLKKLAEDIRDCYSGALVFRYHGDDFVLLTQTPLENVETYFSGISLLKDNGIHVSVKYLFLEAREYEMKQIYDELNH